MEIEKNKVNFDHLWKIDKIDVDIVTFTKYETKPEMSLNDPTKSSIALLKALGSETHKVSPDVQLELTGKVGSYIRGFESGRLGRLVRIKKIIWI